MSNAAHRILWTVVALVLLALGGVGLAMSLGGVPGVDPHAPLLWSGLLRFWRDTRPWGAIVVGVLGLLLAALGYRLLSRELRAEAGPALGDLVLADVTPGRGTAPGWTRIPGEVLVRGLRSDLVGDPAVRRARVVLTGAAPRPELWIQLGIAPLVPVPAVGDHVAAAVERFATTFGLHPRHVEVTMHVDRTPDERAA